MNMANKKIIDLVHAKSQSMQNRPGEAGQNTTLAIAAMKSGIRSPEWRAYMMQFVEQSVPGIPVDERQLNRLLGTDETKDDPEMDRKRAYLVGNAPCMDLTPTGLRVGVESIDEGLAGDCSPLALQPPPPPVQQPKQSRSSKPRKAQKKSASKK
jgi:hypothetical protein